MKKLYSPLRDLFAFRRSEVVFYVLRAYALWLVPSAMACWMMFSQSVPMSIAWAVSLPLMMVAGWGCFAVAGISHEGLHGTLAAKRRRSAMWGALLSAPIPGFYAPGFYVLHGLHHQYVNTERDPVAVHYSKFRSVFSRILLARIAEGPRYFIETIRLLSVGSGRSGAFASFEVLRSAAVLTLVTKSVLITISIIVATLVPRWFITIVFVPTIISVLIASIVPFLEHVGTRSEPAVHSARTQCSWLFSFLRLGANFHLAHHLFPAIPCWRLARVHRELRASDESVVSTVDASLRDSWRTLRGHYGVHPQSG